MNMQQVQSSQIHSVGYDAATKTLAVQFQGKGGVGSVYHYSDVPVEVHAGLVGAESVGKYFGANVKGKFQHEKQEPKPAAQT